MKREKILQISNDISEDCCEASAKELIEVVRFWQKNCDKWINAYNELSDGCSGLLMKSLKIRDKYNKA